MLSLVAVAAASAVSSPLSCVPPAFLLAGWSGSSEKVAASAVFAASF